MAVTPQVVSVAGHVVALIIASLLRSPAQAQVFEVTSLVEPRVPTGERPAGLVPFDFDGDGILDLAVGHRLSDGVGVLLGMPTGRFEAARLSLVPDFFGAIAAGDFDGDGMVDVVAVANQSLWLLSGDGAGGFGGAVESDLLESCEVLHGGVVADDLDGDGALDIAFAAGPHVHVLINDGRGGFGNHWVHDSGAGATALTVLDADEDGLKDLAVVHEGSEDLTILLGMGGGAYARGANLPLGVEPLAVAAADLDRNGHEDLIVVDAGHEEIVVLHGAGDGSFSLRGRVSVGGRPVALAVRDLNGDHKLDLAVACASRESVVRLLGDGAGGFPDSLTFAVGGSPSAIVAMDLRNDGIVDLVVANSATDDLSLLMGDGSGRFAAPETTACGNEPKDFVAADFDGDSIQDVVVSDWHAGLRLLLGDGAGGLQATPCCVSDVPGWPLVAADLDGDGFQDLGGIGGTLGDFGLFALFGDGAGGFPRRAEVATGILSVTVLAADFNNDGIADLATAGIWEPRVAVVLSDGRGGFEAARETRVRFFEIDMFSAIDAGDLNGDRFQDLALAVLDTGDVVLLLGDGEGGFKEQRAYWAAYASPGDIVVSDLDGDRALDIALVAWDAVADRHAVAILKGDGAGSFSGPDTVSIDNEPLSMAASDFDGDGIGDLAVSCGAHVSILRGPPSGGAWGARLAVPGEPRRIRAMDLTMDGVPDLASLSGAGLYLATNRTGFAVPFLRGNANADGIYALDISDPIFVIQYLFYGGPAPSCLDAADANDDSNVDISDPIFLLRFLFSGGPSPPSPYPSCGVDPSPEDLGCEGYALCE